VRHDAQAALQYGSDDRHVCAVPQQLAVFDILVRRETFTLKHRSLHVVSDSTATSISQITDRFGVDDKMLQNYTKNTA